MEDRITLQIELLLDENKKICDAVMVRGDEVKITREEVLKTMPRSLVKKSEGELMIKKMEDSMWERQMTHKELLKKVKIAHSTLAHYKKAPGKIPLAILMKMLRAVGIRQITFDTGGTYYEN